jgi:hypothetical protein
MTGTLHITRPAVALPGMNMQALDSSTDSGWI